MSSNDLRASICEATGEIFRISADKGAASAINSKEFAEVATIIREELRDQKLSDEDILAKILAEYSEVMRGA